MSTPDSPPDEGSGARQFLRLVATGPLDEIRRALAAAPALVNASGPHPFWGGQPQPLHVAIENDRTDVFHELLAAGADVDGGNDHYDGWSPLMLAVTRQRTGMRDALIARGARVGLVEALLLGDDSRTDALLSHGASVLPAPVPNGGSVLAFARTISAIDRLLALDVSADTRDKWGTSPMDAMSRLGPPGAPLVAHLASRGVEVPPEVYARLGDREALGRMHARSPDRVTSDIVVMAAVDLRQHALVWWLLSQGARVDARAAPPSRHTALHAAAWNGDLPMVTGLMEAGADTALRDDEHHGTALDWARVAVGVTRNPHCATVAEYLATVQREPPTAP